MLILARSVIRKSHLARSCAVCAEAPSKPIATELRWRITRAGEQSSEFSLKTRKALSHNTGSGHGKRHLPHGLGAGGWHLALLFRPVVARAFNDKYRDAAGFPVGAIRYKAEKRTIWAQHVPGNGVCILHGRFLCLADFLKRNLFPGTQEGIDRR